jgi:hypothetical protein
MENLLNEGMFRFHNEKIKKLFKGEIPDEPIFLLGMPMAHEEEDVFDRPKCLDRITADLKSMNPNLNDRENFYCPIVELWPYGVHYIDVLFGCKVKYTSNTIFIEKLNYRPGKLKKIDLDNSEVFVQSYELVKYLVNYFDNKLRISTPVLSSPLNIALNLFGEEFLVCLMEDKNEALYSLEVITDAIVNLHKKFKKISPMVRHYASSFRYTPDGFGHICGCSTHLVSGKIYEEIIAPFDEQVLSVYPEGGTIHLCGKHTQHLNAFKGMKKLRGIQINDTAADDFELYLKGLRKDQVIYMSPTQTVSTQTIIEKARNHPVVCCFKK